MATPGIDGRNCSHGFIQGDLIKSSVVDVSSGDNGNTPFHYVVRDPCYLVEAGVCVTTAIGSGAATGACSFELTLSGTRALGSSSPVWTTTFAASATVGTQKSTGATGSSFVDWAAAGNTAAERLLNPGDLIHFVVAAQSTGNVQGWVVLRRALAATTGI